MPGNTSNSSSWWERASAYLPVLFCIAVVWWHGVAIAQKAQPTLNLSTGKDIFLAGCAGCHGPDGRGAPDTTVGFEKPATFPDFTDCATTTPELDVDWKAMISEGGRGRGFSRIMPSFKEMLTSEQIDMVIGHLRSLCKETNWPRGELNLPRPLFTEKAFPESETVITTAVNAKGAPGVANELVYERRLTNRNQLEISAPLAFTHDTGRWLGGVGDIGVGLKRVFFASSHSILSGQGELKFPTGNPEKGTGAGVTVFENFALFGQLLPKNFFLQGQLGSEIPTHSETAPKAVFWRGALGKSFRQEYGYGRMWTPIVEFTADRDIETGAETNWNVVPQFQVTLNRRQHIRFNVGYSIPVNDRMNRAGQVVFYLLWDWFDGGILQGWK